MRRAVLSTLAVVTLALAVWSCREQLVAPGTGTLLGTARTLRITPSRLDLTVGGSATVTATLLDGTGSVVPLPPGFALTFTSSVPDVFATDAAGVTTGVTAGEGVLRAAIGALVVGIPVSVVSNDPRLVIVSGDGQTGAPGAELELPLVVRAEGRKGDPARDVVVDFDVKVGSVNPAQTNTKDDGAATVRWTLGKTVGAQSITARAKGFTSVTFVATAVVRPVASVIVVPDTVRLSDVAQTAQLSATARDADGKDVPAAGFTWASSNLAVVTVSPTGLVTALGAGASTVSATLGSITGSSTVLVTLPVPQSRLAFRPDTLRAGVVAGAQVVAAVQVVEAGGLPAASLGTVSCDAPVYEGAPAAPWLVVQSCGDSVRVLVQAAALTAGTWRANISVRGTLASNSPAVLPVEILVSAAPSIAALPAGALTVTTTLGTDDGVFNRVVDITNGGGGALSGLAAALAYAPGQPVGWIEKLALDSATAPTALRFTVRRGALGIGTYDATVRLTSTIASVQPLDIPLHLVVKASAARLGLSADSVEGISYTNGPTVRVAVDVVERTGLGEAALGAVSCSEIIPAENQKVVSCGDSIVVLLSPGGNLVGSEVASLRVSSAFTADTVTLRVTLTAARPRLRLVPDSLAARSLTNGAAVRVAADVVVDVLKGAPAYPEASLGKLQCTVQTSAGAPPASVAQCGDSIAITVTPGADAGSFRYTVDVQAPDAPVTALPVSLPINLTITAAPMPVIAAAPAPPLTVTTTLGTDDGVFNRVVDITNAGGGTLSGLTATLTYAAGQPVGWIENLKLDGEQAPTALRFTVRRGVLPIGNYDAMLRLASPVAGVQPLDIAVRMTVQSSAARIGLSPDSIYLRSYSGAPPIQAAVAVVERTGLGLAALGTISCSAIQYAEVSGWAELVSCGDSIVVRMSSNKDLGGGDAIIRVTGSAIADTATLRLRFLAREPNLRMAPDSIAVSADANSAAVRVASNVIVDVQSGALAFPKASLGALVCFLTSPTGAPTATVAQCADSVALSVTPGTVPGIYVYRVTVQAPAASVRVKETILPIAVTVTAVAPAPVIVAVPTAPLELTTAFGIDSGVFARAVNITNGGGGALTGVAATITYAPTQSVGWIQNVALDSATAPTALRFTVRRDTLSVGTYDASVRLTSTVAGVSPVDIALRLIVQSGVARLVIVSGNAQTGATDAQLALPLLVRAEQANGKPGRDGVVNFVVTEGSVTPARASTDGFGVATVQWTLGPTAGAQSITANSTGYTSVTFAATAVAPTVARIVITPDTVRLIDVALTAQLTATARDANGKDIPSSGFTWASSNPAIATVSATGLVTAVGTGTSTVTATLGSIVGSSTVIVTVPAVPVIAALPSGQLTFTTTYGADDGLFNRVVDITNGGGGTLSGLAVSVTYAAGQPTNWIVNPALDSPTAPTGLRFTFTRGTLPVGIYDATVRLTSTVVGVLPLDIPVRMVVASNASIGVSPSSIVRRNYTGGPFIRVASAVIERTGLGLAALGTISCSGAQYTIVKGWARVVSCGDSVVVSLEADFDLTNDDFATIRVTGSTSKDTATLRIQLTSTKPRLAFIPDSLVINTTAGVGSVEAVAAVVEADGWLTAAQINDLRCTLTIPSGAPSATVTSCFTDAVTLRVSPGSAVGTFVYSVLVEAPNGIVPITGRVLRVIVNIAAAPPPAPLVANAIFGGCAVDAAGLLYCWGNNTSGEVGDGTDKMRTIPTLVSSSSGPIVRVGAGSAIRCGISANALVPLCWGGNSSGATGQGYTAGLTTVPTRVTNLKAGSYMRIGVGGATVCATLDNGVDVGIYCWGNNEFGQLGTEDGVLATSAPGNRVKLADPFATDVAVGWKHACAIGGQAPYRLSCWGQGWSLGNGTLDGRIEASPVPVAFPDDLPNNGLAAGGETTCLTSYSGNALYCWGHNLDGETGTGVTGVVSVPTRVVLPVGAVLDVVVGLTHACAIVSGATYCWGRNEYGQLGRGDQFFSSGVPQRIAGDPGFYSLAVNGFTTCGRVLADSSVWCWGYGETGELGNGTSSGATSANSAVPVRVSKP